MSISTPSLKEFIEPVPVCEQTVALVRVLEIFSSGSCDRLVVVSEQQHPLGVINLRAMMPHLLVTNSFSQKNYLVAPLTLDLQQPLCHLNFPLIERLTTLPSQLSLKEFRLYLRSCNSQTPQHWAVVDPTHQFLGLLDSQRILKFMATAEGSEEWGIGSSQKRASQAYTPEELQEDAIALREATPLREAALQASGHLRKPPFPWSVATNTVQRPAAEKPTGGQVGQSHGGHKTLVQLLEQLPLPLRLQTSSGQAIAQNLTWRQQIGESFNPPVVQQEAPARLDSLPSVWSEIFAGSSSAQEIQPARRWEPSKQSNRSDLGADEASVSGDSASVMSATEATLTLNNPLDNSSATQPSRTWKKSNERIWQFVKIPLWQNGAELELLETLGKTPVQEFRGNSYLPASSSSLNPDPQSSALGTDLWLVMATDITEQQQVAKELTAKNADLVQLNRMKDEFLACISHELKTPLTSVLGLSSLLKDRVLGQLNERQERYAKLIHQSGRQLMTVVNDILDLTRMETGQLELSPEPVNLLTVCDRALSQARQLQTLKDQPATGHEPVSNAKEELGFTLSIEPGLETIVADDLRLRQMLTHLLSNALKFTEAGGEIGLKVSRWEGWIAFTVWDTGIGIPEAKQHLIFQKFQQLEDPMTRRFDGTGLGLVLTQGLARLHGGDVSFISKPGEGSQFTLLLPPIPPTRKEEGSRMKAQKNRDASFTPHRSSLNRNRLILIVEAAPQYIDHLTQQLTSLGYRAAIARSGTEALEKARRFQPQAILLNPCLPLLSGWDVLTLLKSDDQTCHIPVIVTAANAEKEQAASNRADGFLTLPVQAETLRHSLTCLTKPKQCTNVSLTILHLTSLEQAAIEFSPTALGLSPNHRVLEADDLEQAELLARVWQPDVVILDGGGLEDPLVYLQQLASQTTLASLPLVTLDRPTTEAANQVSSLCVFPCLAGDGNDHTAALLQVIQIAVGMSCKPSILVVDARSLMDLSASVNRYPTTEAFDPRLFAKPQRGSSKASPLIHYLQKAGFRSILSRSWTEVLRQLQQQNVDLLLIDLADMELNPALMEALASLRQMPFLPPILVLEHQNDGVDEPTLELPEILSAIATKILRVPTLSMAEVLDQIHQTLTQSTY
ncbi:ATP-binding protein [Trichocoleus sp. DQ-A3]|uniref:ATP-binding response regulator n=1 Tax=Cyanophyceae TaxID=3028117 RepID=UPI001686A73C|nr:ATP-binding protein [Coleofasciculus sp. FACHB-125]MBD1903384.1 response regulator [Coleofasciculus sp. FACHB-125]